MHDNNNDNNTFDNVQDLTMEQNEIDNNVTATDNTRMSTVNTLITKIDVK